MRRLAWIQCWAYIQIGKAGSDDAKKNRMKESQQPVSGLGNKAIATRESLKQAAVRLINLHGFSSVRVEDITIEAGVAKGLFYRYFTSINDITHVVCEELFQSILQESLTRTYDSSVPAYDWLFDYVSIPVRKFVQNRGLLACMFELHGSFPEISKAWQTTAHEWNLHLEEFVHKAGGHNKREAKEFCYILGAAMEGIIYQSIIRNTPDLKKIASSAASITEIITKMWYRVIFLDSPAKRSPAAKKTA
ncbi:MAG: hypothetical protein JWM77_1436 [Rhodospirillales bacterium]|nr:hypothetical protein [Rhodospirillales bacterium]